MAWVLTMSVAASGVEIHVAPGRIGGEGSRQKPYGSLVAARDAARQALVAGQSVIVILHDGTYFLPDTLRLAAADSGTAKQPVVWRAAAGASPVLSGGRPIRGWECGQGNLWQASVPEGRDWRFDQLFVAGERAIRARYPNLKEKEPQMGGFLFNRLPLGGGGAYGGYLYNMLPGYWTEYDVQIPADGEYRVWFRYAAHNKPYGATDMGGRCSLLVDGQRVELANLPDTGNWKGFAWAPRANADVRLSKGPHSLRWTNELGPGLNIDAIVLCDDPAWKPTAAPPARSDKAHLVEIQAEAFARKHGDKLAVSMVPPPDRVSFDPGQLGAWEHSPDKELVAWIYEGCGTCSNMMQHIVSIDPQRHVLTFAPQKNGHGDLRVPFGARFFVENVREALDAPREWYYDRRTGLLEYMGQEGDRAPRNAIASRLECLLDISADHIRFEGIGFAHTGYRRQVDHWYHAESNAVRLLNANHCRFDTCAFRNLGGGAIVINGTSVGNEILGCEVAETGAGGFTLNSNPDNLYALDPERYTRPPTTRANRIVGNHIHHIGRIWKHGAGIYLHATADNEVMYNDIHDTARHPIIATGRCGGNEISFNRILNSNLETGDCGAIHTYTTWHAKEGNRIRNNIIGDVIGMGTTIDGKTVRPHYTWGIYLDNDTDKTLVQDNIVYRTVRGSVYIHGGSDNIIVNNILVDATEKQFYHGPSRGHDGQGNRFEGNVVAFSSPTGTLGLGPRDKPEIVFSDRNLFWAGGREIKELEHLHELGLDQQSMVADPLFVDPANDDYRLRPDSPAFKLGFQAIDTSRVGRQGWRRGERH
jgi:parallel beta-helix repeat protein